MSSSHRIVLDSSMQDSNHSSNRDLQSLSYLVGGRGIDRSDEEWQILKMQHNIKLVCPSRSISLAVERIVEFC
jgi:hypothetical protein